MWTADERSFLITSVDTNLMIVWPGCSLTGWTPKSGKNYSLLVQQTETTCTAAI